MSPSNKNTRLFKIALHILVWVILSIAPFLLSNSEPLDIIRIIKFTWIPMVFYAIIFYFNFFLLIDKVLFNKNTLLFAGINLGIILVFTFCNFEIREYLNTLPDGVIRRYPPLPKRLFVYKDIISMMIPVIFSIATKFTERWARTENERKEREKEILNSELQHLKYQLQPHFFFNSLNTIYALIERSPELAQETVHNLSKLMRYLLYDTESGKVNLAEEIEFMTKYLNLMKLRISDKTTVHANFPAASEHRAIMPLLFISLIENAFKHGISATMPSEISFGLTMDEKSIKFIAQNTNFPKNEKDKSGSGIGLINLRKRLELSYPGKHHFHTRAEGPLFVASLEIITD